MVFGIDKAGRITRALRDPPEGRGTTPGSRDDRGAVRAPQRTTFIASAHGDATRSPVRRHIPRRQSTRKTAEETA